MLQTRAPRRLPLKPSLKPDIALARKYGGLIAGVDEAGRGPLAGPVVAAAVMFQKRPPRGINDSKQVPAALREALFLKIRQVAVVGVGIVEVDVIDAVNIYHATHAAMCKAVEALEVKPAAILIDGNRCPKELELPAEALVQGDCLSLSIAAASIIAKVTRDRIMQELARQFPVYGFERNKGYGTKDHLAALACHGLSPHHRRSFRKGVRSSSA